MRTIKLKNKRPVVAMRNGAIGAGGFYGHVSIAGESIWEFGAPCGTCGVLFSKLAKTDQRLSDAQAQMIMGDLSTLPDDAHLKALGALLESGEYAVEVFEGVPTLVTPGADEDFFVTDYARLHGEPHDPADLHDPKTSYFRFGQQIELPNAAAWGAPWPALLLSFLLPLQNLRRLDKGRVAELEGEAWTGKQLTALAVSIVDQQSPATDVCDPTYPYREHRAVVHFLIDGHHRAAAAANTGKPLRVLSFVRLDASIADAPALRDAVEKLSASVAD